MSIMMIVMSIGSISSPLSAAARSSSSADMLFQIIDIPPRDVSGVKEPEVAAGEDITLENVNFTYPTRPDTRVLTGLNMRFPAGKITAIVGPSGSGKSTIVGLIERWYELDGDFQANLKVCHQRQLTGQIS
jgi:ATP-binding cassette, subfamily B (MDR/TAP), member 1